MAHETAYPYTELDQTCKAGSVYHPYKGIAYHYLSNETYIPSHIYTDGPVAFYLR